jgi:aspartate 1-decarboxylase
MIQVLKSKLHRACVTDARLEYMGSVKIDAELMDKANIKPYEVVMIADLENGNRLETYAVPTTAGSRELVILGAAAHLVKTGDRVIIFSFAWCDADKPMPKPAVIVLDEHNNVIDRE